MLEFISMSLLALLWLVLPTNTSQYVHIPPFCYTVANSFIVEMGLLGNSHRSNPFHGCPRIALLPAQTPKRYSVERGPYESRLHWHVKFHGSYRYDSISDRLRSAYSIEFPVGYWIACGWICSPHLLRSMGDIRQSQRVHRTNATFHCK